MDMDHWTGGKNEGVALVRWGLKNKPKIEKNRNKKALRTEERRIIAGGLYVKDCQDSFELSGSGKKRRNNRLDRGGSPRRGTLKGPKMRQKRGKNIILEEVNIRFEAIVSTRGRHRHGPAMTGGIRASQGCQQKIRGRAYSSLNQVEKKESSIRPNGGKD